jgi:hypothetical protein
MVREVEGVFFGEQTIPKGGVPGRASSQNSKTAVKRTNLG